MRSVLVSSGSPLPADDARLRGGFAPFSALAGRAPSSAFGAALLAPVVAVFVDGCCFEKRCWSAAPMPSTFAALGDTAAAARLLVRPPLPPRAAGASADDDARFLLDDDPDGQKIQAAGELPVFFIGDPKQAIYSFRGADIFAYLDAVEGLCIVDEANL